MLLVAHLDHHGSNQQVMAQIKGPAGFVRDQGCGLVLPSLMGSRPEVDLRDGQGPKRLNRLHWAALGLMKGRSQGLMASHQLVQTVREGVFVEGSNETD